MKRLTLAVPDFVHSSLKSYAAARGLTLSEWLKAAILARLHREERDGTSESPAPELRK